MNDTDSKADGHMPTPLSIERECFPCADLCAYRNRDCGDFPCSECDGRDEFRLHPSIVHAVNAHAGLLEKVAYLDSELVLANAAGAELAAGRDQFREALEGHVFFSRRLEIATEIEAYRKATHISSDAFGYVCAFNALGYLKEKTALAPPEPEKEAKE